MSSLRRKNSHDSVGEKDWKVLNRTLKFELQVKTSQTSASSSHHLMGCVLASKKFWRLLQGAGRVAKRRIPCRGTEMVSTSCSTLFLGSQVALTRTANFLFLLFQNNMRKLPCSGRGKERWLVAGSTFERRWIQGVFFLPCSQAYIVISWGSQDR